MGRKPRGSCTAPVSYDVGRPARLHSRAPRAHDGAGGSSAGIDFVATRQDPGSMLEAPDLVFLGNLIVDDMVFTDGRTRFGQAGGAMLYATLGASVWGVTVAVVAPVGSDYPRETLEALKARGVDLSGLRPLGRPGLRHWLL